MLSTSPCYSRLRHAGRSQGSGLRMRCCAAPPRPRRCHGDGAGRGLAEAWGALETGPFSNSLSSLSFLLSSLFAFCCFPSLLICSLFPQTKSSAAAFISPSVSPLHVCGQTAVRKFGTFAFPPSHPAHTPTGALPVGGHGFDGT